MIVCRRYGSQLPYLRQRGWPVGLSSSPRVLPISRRQDVRSLHVEKLPRRQNPDPAAKEVAVLGGGITGLSAAFFLTQQLPNAKVTIIEKSGRLGGWLESPIHELDDGKVVFENGPRTLRQDLWNGFYTREIIEKLNLQDDIVSIPKGTPAAVNRFIYYPDHLVRMPGPIPGASLFTNIWQNVSNILREPVFDKLLPSVIGELTDEERRIAGAVNTSDESVEAFVSRRFSPQIANNIVSAVLHGIYAGDISKLSARSLLPLFWHYDGMGGSIIESMARSTKLLPRRQVELVTTSWDGITDFDSHLRGNLTALQNSSVFTFKNGLEQLVTALKEYVWDHPNISIKLNTNLLSLTGPSDQQPGILPTATSSKNNQPLALPTFSHAISTLSRPTMSALLSSTTPTTSSSFASGPNSTSTVMVVNLFFRQPNLLPVQGFGYLIPRSIPFEQNPECALGVIFGSDSSIGQDTAQGTKLTVMMGGHWWSHLSPSELPDSDSATKMSLDVLKRHLGITATPILSDARLAVNAIPQYEVGDHANLSSIHANLTSTDKTVNPFGKGRIKLAGSWYTGVGVNDCVTAARQAVEDIREGRDENSGVEGLVEPRWCVEDKREGVLRWSEGKRDS